MPSGLFLVIKISFAQFIFVCVGLCERQHSHKLQQKKKFLLCICLAYLARPYLDFDFSVPFEHVLNSSNRVFLVRHAAFNVAHLLLFSNTFHLELYT
jgi:hypothetical protein